jgi:glycosyltransferase involved in cell wall biosynthesis
VKISACIITLDEEDNIRDCIESVAFCDEVVVVDSGSNDRTREIAAELGARVIQKDWPGHIEQKNFAIDAATNDWVLCIDADERVSPELRGSLDRLFAAGEPPLLGYACNRRTRYLGRWIYHSGWYPDRKLRLFRKSRGRWGGVNPHDHVKIDGPQGRLDGDLLHLSYRDVSDHLKTIDFLSTISAREKWKKRQRLPVLQLVFGPPLKFLKAYVLKLGFLDGLPGFAIAVLGSYFVFLKYLKLLEFRLGLAEPGEYPQRGRVRAKASGSRMHGSAAP